MTREYKSAAAFKQALEQRLRTSSTSGVDFDRGRQLVIFDRFLARIAAELGDAATLKGGLAVELRGERARTTKDVDLRVTGSPEGILDRLRDAARRDRVHSSIRSLRMNQNGDGPKIHGPGQISVYEPRNSASTTHELEQFFSKNHPSAVESHPVFRQNAEHAVITGGWGIARVVEHLGHRGSLSSFGTRSRSNRGPGF